MSELGFTNGFVDAFVAFALALAVFGVGLFIYTTITPFKETQLIRAGNAAAWSRPEPAGRDRSRAA